MLGKLINQQLPRPSNLHGLRHRFATTIYQHTHDIIVVQQLLGHESVATTQRYLAYNVEQLCRAANLADAAGTNRIVLDDGPTTEAFLKETNTMEHDLLIRQHDELVQLAQELAAASEALATSMAGDEAAIPAPTAYELLTNLMGTLLTLSRTTEDLRVRLVASLYRTGIGLAHVDLMSGETREPEESVLAADADIFSSATSLELAERCLSRARNAIAAQTFEHAIGNRATASRNTT